MQVSASFTFPDTSSIDLHYDDCQDGFDPLRLKDISVELRETFRLVLADCQHERAEHEPE